MNKKPILVTGLVVLLISCVLFAGCTDNSSETNTTTQTTVGTPSPSGSAKYVSGDIVRIPSSSAATDYADHRVRCFNGYVRAGTDLSKSRWQLGIPQEFQYGKSIEGCHGKSIHRKNNQQAARFYCGPDANGSNNDGDGWIHDADNLNINHDNNDHFPDRETHLQEN